jgi:hypothetical protein
MDSQSANLILQAIIYTKTLLDFGTRVRLAAQEQSTANSMALSQTDRLAIIGSFKKIYCLS